MPGVNATSVDVRLASLLDTHGYEQHVTAPTRRSSRSDNLLGLLISSSSTFPHQLLSNVAVRSSHHHADHELVTCDLLAWRHKPSAIRYVYRNIKSIEFEARLRSSQLFTDPAVTPDEYLGQFEATVSDLLDDVAPLRHGTRPGGRKSSKGSNLTQSPLSNTDDDLSDAGRRLGTMTIEWLTALHAVEQTRSSTLHGTRYGISGWSTPVATLVEYGRLSKISIRVTLTTMDAGQLMTSFHSAQHWRLTAGRAFGR